MNNLMISTQYDTNATLISNTFIDQYMAQANGEFVKIYIYLLRSVSDASHATSISTMADTFNQTETDVIRALKYWSKNGIIHLTLDAKTNEITGIMICDLKRSVSGIPASLSVADTFVAATDIDPAVATNTAARQRTNIQNSSVDFVAVHSGSAGEPAAIDPVTIEMPAEREIKSYTPAQIEQLSADDIEFAMLLRGIKNYLGGSLSSSEISSVAYFYDSLKFPSELIEYLIEYCAGRGHKKMRYIEKVALAWADAGIKSVKDAKNETSSHNEITYSVMNAFGLSSRDPGQRERDYIAKWTNVYGFNTDLIIEACNRTLKATHQPSFEYADSILTKWYNDNIKTLTDVMHADAKYELTRQSKKNAGYSKAGSAGSNKFNNFSQRDTDINDLESALLNNNQ